MGTTALSIFTLLDLYSRTGDAKYLESAVLGGNWLITMQKKDGSMKPFVEYENGIWSFGNKESLLYNGQTLSALSKLFQATADRKYFETAKRIAIRFKEKYEQAQAYIEGEYRSKNPISNAWAVMSCLDFYKVISDEKEKESYKSLIFELSSLILDNQKDEPEKILDYGGWEGAFSTSGVGWISEVMAETFQFCLEQKDDSLDCEKYKEAVIKGIRWIIQNTYSNENSFLNKNPDRALGGIFWNWGNKYVRTDSVCHGLNAYLLIIDYLDEGLLISIPEDPLEEILAKLKQ